MSWATIDDFDLPVGHVSIQKRERIDGCPEYRASIFLSDIEMTMVLQLIYGEECRYEFVPEGAWNIPCPSLEYLFRQLLCFIEEIR